MGVAARTGPRPPDDVSRPCGAADRGPQLRGDRLRPPTPRKTMNANTESEKQAQTGELTDLDRRELEMLVDGFDDPVQAVADSITAGRREALLAFGLGHTGPARELAGTEGDWEPAITEHALVKYVRHARELEPALTDNALSRLAQHDQPVRLRRLAYGSARLHLRDAITVEDVEVATDVLSADKTAGDSGR